MQSMHNKCLQTVRVSLNNYTLFLQYKKHYKKNISQAEKSENAKYFFKTFARNGDLPVVVLCHSRNEKWLVSFMIN